jgi:2-dehydropantoate 2-reductase
MPFPGPSAPTVPLLPANPRVAVVGAGAIGGFLGGMMAKDGVDVTLVDQWPEHVEAIRSGGLRLSDTIAQYRAEPVAIHLHELQSVPAPFDVILLSVKAYDTDWAARLAAGYLAPDGVIVVGQNGITDDRVAAIVGAHRTVGCVITIAVALFEPGVVSRTDAYEIGLKVGELAGPAVDRTNQLAELLGSGARCVVTDDLAGQRWSKLALNCMINAVAGITGYGAGEIRSLPELLPLVTQLACEVIEVGRASGVEVAPIMGIPAQAFVDATATGDFGPVGMQMRSASRSTSTHPASMLQDVRKGRRTEIEELNGFVAAQAERLGLSAPLCAALADIVRKAGVGGLRPDRSNLDAVLSLRRETAVDGDRRAGHE